MDKAKFKSSVLAIKNNRLITKLLPIFWLIMLAVIFGINSNGMFFHPFNLSIIVDQSLIVATVATGASFIYGTGNVNIAMGATTGLVAAIAIKVYVATQSVPLMFIAAFVSGIVIGILAVIVSSKFKVKVLFVTVVMMTLLLAIQQTVLNNQTISIPYEITSALRGANFPYIAFGIYFIACLIIFNFTKVGRSIKFIGTNSDCSKATGIVYNKYLLIAFIMAGIGAALGALMTITRTGSVSNFTATTLNMDVLLAIVLGGMSVFGGSKSYIYSATLGAITVVVLNNGLQMLDVDSVLIQGIRGVFFLVLVVASQTRTNLLPEKD